MAMDAIVNFGYSTVATAPSPATSGTSLAVVAGTGSRFPATPFNAVVWPNGQIPTPLNAEVVRVTARASDTLTISRAQESSTARSVIVGDQIAAAITAKTLTDLRFPILQISTLTGTQNDFALSPSTRMLQLRLNNASLLQLTGFSAGVDGDVIDIISVGTGQVDLIHENGGSSAANRLANLATSGITSLSPGKGHARYIYDGTNSRWRLILHEQGAWIVRSYQASDFTASTGTWTVDSGDLLSFSSWLRGKTITVQWAIQTSSISSTPGFLNILIPQGFTSVRGTFNMGLLIDNGSKVACFIDQASDKLRIFRMDLGNLSVSVNLTEAYGEVTFEVT
jgi:hypothetical protein